ncbi:hypothetical protein GCK72_002842 [Caenorhabditis remanei]|uniref:Uncharacterized protein n=1 Tax=Caenorhabditis remanei TaxID=31234 RepID=E3MVT1_CAERE|nr:hypothetical protein GCK72_002842 [Caenorhabditis remanei]EFP10349.1 hypothetical protein CRE_23557 [Caenorhabditis remanei]KAF1771018.1 hypothetical protein GCK72_002842 [Caenorhabditis remanei]
MADKSAFVPVDAIGNHKNTDLDVDIDDELFGKKPPSSTPAASSSASKIAAPVVTKPTSPAVKSPAAPVPAPPAKYQYKKSTNYTKTYAK